MDRSNIMRQYDANPLYGLCVICVYQEIIGCNYNTFAFWNEGKGVQGKGMSEDNKTILER